MKPTRYLLLMSAAATLFACGSGSPEPVPAPPQPDTTAVPAQQPAATGSMDPVPDTTIANGPVEVKYPDGKPRIKGNMRDHKRHGMWTSYFPDGRPQSFKGFVNGELHGTTVVYHPNGTTYYSGEYRKGLQVGEWRFFDDKGTLVRTVTYDASGTVINDRK